MSYLNRKSLISKLSKVKSKYPSQIHYQMYNDTILLYDEPTSSNHLDVSVDIILYNITLPISKHDLIIRFKDGKVFNARNDYDNTLLKSLDHSIAKVVASSNTKHSVLTLSHESVNKIVNFYKDTLNFPDHVLLLLDNVNNIKTNNEGTVDIKFSNFQIK